MTKRLMAGTVATLALAGGVGRVLSLSGEELTGGGIVGAFAIVAS